MVSKERLEEYMKLLYSNSPAGTEKPRKAPVSGYLVLWLKFEMSAFQILVQVI
jgi:hypothetical protein